MGTRRPHLPDTKKPIMKESRHPPSRLLGGPQAGTGRRNYSPPGFHVLSIFPCARARNKLIEEAYLGPESVDRTERTNYCPNLGKLLSGLFYVDCIKSGTGCDNVSSPPHLHYPSPRKSLFTAVIHDCLGQSKNPKSYPWAPKPGTQGPVLEAVRLPPVVRKLTITPNTSGLHLSLNINQGCHRDKERV